MWVFSSNNFLACRHWNSHACMESPRAHHLQWTNSLLSVWHCLCVSDPAFQSLSLYVCLCVYVCVCVCTAIHESHLTACQYVWVCVSVCLCKSLCVPLFILQPRSLHRKTDHISTTVGKLEHHLDPDLGEYRHSHVRGICPVFKHLLSIIITEKSVCLFTVYVIPNFSLTCK